jgi:hypothetical protein
VPDGSADGFTDDLDSFIRIAEEEPRAIARASIKDIHAVQGFCA